MSDLERAILVALNTLEFEWHKCIKGRHRKAHRFLGGVPEPVLMCWIEADIVTFNPAIDLLKRREWVRSFTAPCPQTQRLRIPKPDGRVVDYESSLESEEKWQYQRHHCEVCVSGGDPEKKAAYESRCSPGTCRFLAITDKGLAQVDTKIDSVLETERGAIPHVCGTIANAIEADNQTKAETPQLSDIERAICESLGGQCRTGQEIADQPPCCDIGYKYGGRFREALAGLVRRGILTKHDPGYQIHSNYKGIF